MEVPLRLYSLLRHADTTFDARLFPDIIIGGVQDDSRRVRAGDLFIARPGVKSTGQDFTLHAVRQGAVAVVAEAPIEGVNVPQIIVPNAAIAVAKLSMAINEPHAVRQNAWRHRHEWQDDHHLPAS